MSGDRGAGPGLSDEYLARVHDAFRAYDESGDVFARAKLVSTIGKSYAPDLLAEVERLRLENQRLREALLPFARLADELTEASPDEAAPMEILAHILARDLRIAARAMTLEVES
jgi:hypothetical protein